MVVRKWVSFRKGLLGRVMLVSGKVTQRTFPACLFHFGGTIGDGQLTSPHVKAPAVIEKTLRREVRLFQFIPHTSHDCRTQQRSTESSELLYFRVEENRNKQSTLHRQKRGIKVRPLGSHRHSMMWRQKTYIQVPFQTGPCVDLYKAYVNSKPAKEKQNKHFQGLVSSFHLWSLVANIIFLDKSR